MSASVPKYALKTLELLRPFFNMRKTRKSRSLCSFSFLCVCIEGRSPESCLSWLRSHEGCPKNDLFTIEYSKCA